MMDTGSACVFQNDGKEGACDQVSVWKFKDGATLCDFHAGFIRSVDYFNEHGIPRRLK